jgi:NAD(P)-dependent dehydrogenase (short-subunit alcohol dehydrogenase family)
MSGRLAGKIAIVTGAARGQGEGVARAFVAEGARVALLDVLDEAGARVASELGAAARYFHCDLVQEQNVRAAIDGAAAHFGGLDILYNNAGIAPVGRDGFTPFIAEEDWEWILRVNLTSVFLCCKYAVPVLAHRPGAAIVNTASSMAILPLGMTDAYAAAKAGVAMLTRSMAPSCALMGIRVNALAPGYVDTPMNRIIFDDPALRAAFAKDHATGLQPPEDVAHVAVFLASDEAAGLTGAVVACDRGWTAFKRPAALAP